MLYDLLHNFSDAEWEIEEIDDFFQKEIDNLYSNKKICKK